MTLEEGREKAKRITFRPFLSGRTSRLLRMHKLSNVFSN